MPRSCAPVRLGAGEGRQERVMGVDHRRADAREELAGEDPHVAREDDQLDVSGQELEHVRLGGRLRVRLNGDVVERDAEGLDVASMVVERGDDRVTSPSKSPRRRRQSRSSRQRSSRDAISATRLGASG
jgi:hypothetical protein